jgi:acetyl esterase/lipase
VPAGWFCCFSGSGNEIEASLFLLAAVAAVQALQAQDAASFSEDAGNKYWIRPDVVYGVKNGHENKLDVIYPHNATAAVPAVIYIHGGGWIFGDKAGAVLETLPYLKMGWAAVNVEYRMASASKLPARWKIAAVL